ncbi:hypothetical protein DY000_02058851 [Brassica cretica]|uniref:Uncharacterized protein n=1 Tax=Brassica cretica TaxID=69181 RepID=A0ABQ7B4F5_BRACR|nr:hypothetical protein DY000_02058851 [Brassica cretica]
MPQPLMPSQRPLPRLLKPPPLYLAWQLNSDEDQCPISSPVYVSDSSPARPFVQHEPTKREVELARHLVDCKTVPATKLITVVDPQLWDLFSTTLQTVANILHVNPMTAAFTNNALLRLVSPMQWVTSTDMEILIYTVGVAHKSMLSVVQSIFLSSWLRYYIQKKWRQFNAAYDKDKFLWDKKTLQPCPPTSPLSVKFMEMHANGGPEPYMCGLTDPLVDELRKQYALDIYKSIALPIYGTPPSMTT